MVSLSNTASQIRRDIVRMVHGVQSGHPGGSLGCTDFLTALYFKVMEHNPSFNMDGINEDVFVLSNGHISPVFYSCLARSGYFPIEETEINSAISILEKAKKDKTKKNQQKSFLAFNNYMVDTYSDLH